MVGGREQASCSLPLKGLVLPHSELKASRMGFSYEPKEKNIHYRMIVKTRNKTKIYSQLTVDHLGRRSMKNAARLR